VKRATALWSEEAAKTGFPKQQIWPGLIERRIAAVVGPGFVAAEALWMRTRSLEKGGVFAVHLFAVVAKDRAARTVSFGGE
jgi:hypothetical protein